MRRLVSLSAPKLITLIACTLIVIFTLIPSLGHLIKLAVTTSGAKSTPQIAKSENRYLNTFPTDAKNFTAFTTGLDNYINDHFALRAFAIKSHNKLQRALGATQLAVYAGRDGWFFLGNNAVWSSHQGRGDFSQQTILAFEKMVQHIQTKCEENGIAFVATIPPNKSSIYTEHTPLRFGQKSKRNFHDAVMNKNDHTAINLINIKPILLAQKHNHQLYYKTDTHWTPHGAFLAYQALMSSLRQSLPRLKILKRKQLRETIRRDYKGDLTVIGDIKNVSENVQLLRSGSRRRFSVNHVKYADHPKTWKTSIYTLKGARRQRSHKLVIIGDSFSDYYINFLKVTFDEIIIIHHKLGAFDLDEVFSHQPDAVIFNVVERFADITANNYKNIAESK